MPFSFRPRLLPTLAAVFGVLITALLGNWQLNRAAEKAQLQERMQEAGRHAPIHLGAAQLEPGAVAYFPVEAKGEFVRDATVYVDNRVRNGVTGYEIVTPLRVEGSSRYVLVDRGWVQAGVDRSRLPEVTTPAGMVAVEGIALPGNRRVFELSGDVEAGRVWQNVTVDRFRKAFGLDLQPIVLYQQSDLGDGLLREWRRPDTGIDRHRGYAVQWFSMSLTIVGLYVILNVRRATGTSRAA